MPRRFVDGEKVEKWVRTCNTLDLVVGYIHEYLWLYCLPLGSCISISWAPGKLLWNLWVSSAGNRISLMATLSFRQFVAHHWVSTKFYRPRLTDGLTYFRACNGRITANNTERILIDFPGIIPSFQHLHWHFVSSCLTDIFHFPPNCLQFYVAMWCVRFVVLFSMCINIFHFACHPGSHWPTWRMLCNISSKITAKQQLTVAVWACAKFNYQFVPFMHFPFQLVFPYSWQWESRRSWELPFAVWHLKFEICRQATAERLKCRW